MRRAAGAAPASGIGGSYSRWDDLDSDSDEETAARATKVRAAYEVVVSTTKVRAKPSTSAEPIDYREQARPRRSRPSAPPPRAAPIRRPPPVAPRASAWRPTPSSTAGCG